MQYNTINTRQDKIIQYNTIVQYNTIQLIQDKTRHDNTIQYGIMQYGTIKTMQYIAINTIQCITRLDPILSLFVKSCLKEKKDTLSPKENI